MSQGLVRPADRRRGSVRPAADGGVLAGVRVLPAGLQAVAAAAILRVHLRLGQLRHGAPPHTPRVRGRCARWGRVSENFNR